HEILRMNWKERWYGRGRENAISSPLRIRPRDLSTLDELTASGGVTRGRRLEQRDLFSGPPFLNSGKLCGGGLLLGEESRLVLALEQSCDRNKSIRSGILKYFRNSRSISLLTTWGRILFSKNRSLRRFTLSNLTLSKYTERHFRTNLNHGRKENRMEGAK